MQEVNKSPGTSQGRVSEAEPPGEKAEPLQAEQEDHVCVGLHHAHARCSAVGLFSLRKWEE